MTCKDCFSGTLHTEEPKGTVTTLHGLATYVSEPPDGKPPKGIIVHHTDAFGWELPNSRVLSDHYAERTGCRVYTPDFMAGSWMPHEILGELEYLTATQPTWGATFYKIFPFLHVLFYGPQWKYRNRMAVARPRTVKFFQDLRAAEAADLPLGVAGFCFGGLYTFELAKKKESAANGKPLIDCGFTAHPSQLQVPKDGEEAHIPLSVCIGDDDMGLKADKAMELQEVLGKNPVEHEMVILPGVKHGFAVRWNPHKEVENKNAQIAEDQAVAWFKKQFKI